MLKNINPLTKSCMIFEPSLRHFYSSKGEGMDGLGVSTFGVFDHSPFSNLVADRVSFLLGAIDKFLKSIEKKRIDSLKGKARRLNGSKNENDGSKGF